MVDKMEAGKVGIVTIKDYNYGNRLQNYALQQAVKEVGREPESLYFDDISKAYYLSKTNNPIRRFIKIFIPTEIIRRKREKDSKPAQKLFDEFTDKYINSKNIEIRKRGEIKKSVNKAQYSCFLAGSDQIWNPKFAGDEYFFLTFAEKKQKKAYAASIGYEDIPKKLQSKWERYWKDFEKITVREGAASKLIEKYTGQAPEVVLDPTLLVEKKVWDELSDKAHIPSEIRSKRADGYVLMFFIGGIPFEVQKYKEVDENTVIDISDENSALRQKIGPVEFIRLIRDADYVLTDSYHCLIFSIIYQKKYRVFERNTAGLKSMNSRMGELFNITGLDYNMESNNYENVEKKLEIKRQESWNILKQMI